MHNETHNKHIAVFLTVDSFGQVICPSDNYDLYNDKDTINLVIDGFKQGKWIYYDKILSCNDCNECKSNYAVLTFRVLSTGHYCDNQKDGNWIYYHNDSLISRYVKYNKGKIDSIDTSFDLQGKILSKAYWDNGVKDSIIVFYNTGKTKYKGIYQSDELSEIRIYYPNGFTKYVATQITDNIANDLKLYTSQGQQLPTIDKDISRIGMIEELTKYMDY